MSDLLFSGFRRIVRSPGWWIAFCAALCFGAFFGDLCYDSQGGYIDVAYFIFLQGLFAIQISLCVGREWEEGGFRNKVIKGHTKKKVFACEVLLALCQSLILTLFSLLVFSVFCGDVLNADTFPMGMTCLLGILLLCGVTATVIVTLCLLIPSRAVAVVLCVLLVMGMFFAADHMGAALRRPEKVRDFTTTLNPETGEFETAFGPYYDNPHYLKGFRREVYDFLYHLNPTGQAELYLDLLNDYIHMDPLEWKRDEARENAMKSYPVYSLGLMVVMLCGGCLIFCRRDMK